MTWGLLITEPAARHLRKLPRHDLEHVDAALDEMRVNPYSGDIKFLRAAAGALRRRVGVWRILFDVHKDKHLVIVLAVKRRRSTTY
jgi:mRNA-degrading endonuclease RelE of RelBE toxin-antitoxin system